MKKPRKPVTTVEHYLIHFARTTALRTNPMYSDLDRLAWMFIGSLEELTTNRTLYGATMSDVARLAKAHRAAREILSARLEAKPFAA